MKDVCPPKSGESNLGNPIDRVKRAATFEGKHTHDHGHEPESSIDPSENLEDLKQDYEIEQLKEQVNDLSQGRRHRDDVHRMRKKFAPWLFGLVCIWLIVVSTAIFFTGFNFYEFNLSDKVLIAFIATTTANVLGLFYVVAKWLYPNGNAK